MGQLFELGRVEDVKEYLGKLPPDLEATYKQLFVAIQSQRGSRPHIAARAFQWIMSSIIPLSPDRLLAAVCQDPEKDEVNEVTVDIDFILGACRNLLVVDRVQNKCRFAHLSIQEYLEQNHWTPHESNTLVTKVCLLVLQTPDEWTHGTSGSLILQQSSAVPDDYETSNRAYAMSTLLSYSRFYWVSHIKEHEKGEIDDRVAMLLKRFLGSMDASSPAYQRWFEQSPRVHSYHSQVVDLSTRLRPSTSASFAVACFGFHGLLSDWWKLGFTNIDQQNEFGDSLLVLAAESWSAETVRKVLQMGANVNALGGRYGSALNCALNQGQRSIIELLLKNEAEVNFRDFGQDSVLLLALWERYRDVPEHARSGWIDDIRELATETVWGNKETIRRLLENGADPNATGSKIDAPISLSHITVKLPPPPQSAIDTLEEKRRCLKIVRHFLEGITDLDTGAYGSALIAAVCSQSAEIVRRLIDRGANVNLEAGGMYGSALSAAVQRAVGIHASALMKNKRILIMHLLLEAGANVTEHIRHAAEGDSTINDILQRYASVE